MSKTKGTITMKANVENANEKKVRCTFDLTESEARKLCDLRCEPKPSTAAQPPMMKHSKPIAMRRVWLQSRCVRM